MPENTRRAMHDKVVPSRRLDASVMVPVDFLLLLLEASWGVQDVQHAQSSVQGNQQEYEKNDDLKEADLYTPGKAQARSTFWKQPS